MRVCSSRHEPCTCSSPSPVDLRARMRSGTSSAMTDSVTAQGASSSRSVVETTCFGAVLSRCATGSPSSVTCGQ